MNHRLYLYGIMAAALLSGCAQAPQFTPDTDPALNSILPPSGPTNSGSLADPTKFIDTNNDGIPDAVDRNGDGTADTPLIPADENDHPNSYDNDGDGKVDTKVEDTNENGIADEGDHEHPIGNDDEDEEEDEWEQHDLEVCHESHSGNKKYRLCFAPPGNLENRHELCLPSHALAVHLRISPTSTCGRCQ